MGVTPENIAVALGRPAPEQDSLLWQQWDMWIADAQRLIALRAEQLGKSYGSLSPDVLDYVVRESVVDHARNPDLATTVDVRIDDGSIARTVSAPSNRRVSIAGELWEMLDLSDTRQAFTITPYGARPPRW